MNLLVKQITVILSSNTNVCLYIYFLCRKYITITCPDQRSKYKEDFNAEYDEYRNLHSVIDRVSKKFAHLEERLRQEERGTEGYEVDN